MRSNHKYLVLQAPVLILFYITALIEITAVGSGKIGSVIDNRRALAHESYSSAKNTVFSYIVTIFAPAARRGLFGGWAFFDSSANTV